MTEKLKVIKIIHLAQCTGLILAIIILGDFTAFEQLAEPSFDQSAYIYLLIPIAAIILSNFLYKNQIKNVDKKLKLEEKMPFYQTASIIRWAILEGAAFIILILKPDFAILGILLFLYIIFIRPTEGQLKRDFEYTRV